MRPAPLFAPLLASALAASASAQWTDVRKIGTGGESTVVSDGKGNVYLTAHIPCTLYKSADWGDKFAKVKAFPDALGDMFVLPHGDGLLNVVYVRSAINGIGSWYSKDGGATMAQGTNIEGPLDREWMVADPKTGQLYLDFSNGYIGGPPSKGVFLQTSTDNGATFKPLTRVDREPEGSYPVDPYLTSSSDGKIYAMWEVTKDRSTIESFGFAASNNGGKTFGLPQTVAEFPKMVAGQPVDTQERWILGSVLGVGTSTVVVVFPGYEHVTIDGVDHKAFVQHIRVSEDGGESFGKSRTLLSENELTEAILSFEKKRQPGKTYRYYIQTLPWLCADPSGGVHVVFTDNRAGQSVSGKDFANNWQLRMASVADATKPFGPSEAVSHVYASKRPPMDFVSCAADGKYVYVSWTENPNVLSDWPNAGLDMFTGELYVARKALK